MASLPPKPESPSKDGRRPDGRDPATTARPMAPVRFRTDRLSDNDRSYIPRSRVEPDTYIAPYDPRRPPRDWERDRDLDRRRDPPRRDNWRDPDRRDRPFDWRRDDDRFRPRRYDSAYRRSSRSPRRPSRSPPRYRSRSRSPPRRRSRSPRRFSRSISPRGSRSRTRSPRRRPHSPRSRARAPSRSRSPVPPPKSPPSKRLRLGNHSISDSPRSRSHARSRSRTYSRSPRRPDKSPPPKKPASPALVSHPLSPKTTGNFPPRPTGDNEHAATAHKVTGILAARTDSPNPTASAAPSLVVPPTTSVDPLIKPESKEEPVRMEQVREESTKTPSTPKPDMRGRSPSPPKGPRGMASQWRKNSKSPPKGPRNQSSMPAIASGPIYPTGPRAGRRPQGPGTPVEQVQQATQIQDISKTTLAEQLDWRQGMVYDPGPKGRYGVGLLDLDLTRFQSHRVHLNKDYDQISRSTRRALHELDMATIDLRMAENRRKIADIQLEKAKHGMLGIDAAQSDLVIDQ